MNTISIGSSFFLYLGATVNRNFFCTVAIYKNFIQFDQNKNVLKTIHLFSKFLEKKCLPYVQKSDYLRKLNFLLKLHNL